MGDEAIEIQAKAMGWVPQEDFKGNPDIWKDAESFVKDGYEILPILRERTKKMAVSMDTTNKELAETKSLLKTLTDHHKKTEESAYQRALKTLKAEQREAVADNDIKKFDAIDKQIETLEKPVIETIPEEQPDFVMWKGENAWYGQRTDMANYADTIAEYVQKQNPTLKGKPFFDLVTDEVKKRFPDQFENINKKKPDLVEGSSGDNGTGEKKGKKKTYGDMDQQAQDTCDMLVTAGVMEKDQYVKEYWDLAND